jgi:hypothetical protein
MVSTGLGTLLIPFLAGVFYFSTKKQRMTPMFTFVVLSIISTIGQAVLYIAIEVQLQSCVIRSHIYSLYVLFQISTLYNPNADFVAATSAARSLIVAFAFLPNLLVDFALLCRVLAVYPRLSTPARKFWMILCPLILCKVVRLASWVIVYHDIGGVSHVYDLVQTKSLTGYVVERTFTLVDNLYEPIFLSAVLTS